MSPPLPGVLLKLPAWDGYQGSRQRLLQHVWDEQIDNVIAVTGDTHAAWLNEISFETTVQGSKNPNDTTPISLDGNSYQKGTIIEYGGSSVSSNGWGASLSDIANATAHAQQVADSTSGLLFSEGYCECHKENLSNPDSVRPRLHAPRHLL